MHTRGIMEKDTCSVPSCVFCARELPNCRERRDLLSDRNVVGTAVQLLCECAPCGMTLTGSDAEVMLRTPGPRRKKFVSYVCRRP